MFPFWDDGPIGELFHAGRIRTSRLGDTIWICLFLDVLDQEWKDKSPELIAGVLGIEMWQDAQPELEKGVAVYGRPVLIGCGLRYHRWNIS